MRHPNLLTSDDNIVYITKSHLPRKASIYSTAPTQFLCNYDIKNRYEKTSYVQYYLIMFTFRCIDLG